MRLPERASIPRRSSAAWRSAWLVRSPRSAGTVRSLVLNARWSAALSLPFTLASSSSTRPTPIHAPRPGARARTSGATVPSGPSARRINSSLVPLRRVRTHVRSGTCDSRSSVTPSAVSLSFVRNRVLLAGGLGILVLEPVGAGSHDDLIALLFGEAVVAQQPTLVLGPVARLAAARLDALLLHELVGGEVGKVVQRPDPGLAKRDQHLLRKMRDFGERVLDAELAALLA